MSLLLVVALPEVTPEVRPDAAAAPGEPSGRPGIDPLWGTVRQELAVLRDAPLRAFVPGRLEVLTAGLDDADDDPTVAYASCADEALHAVGRAIDAGASRNAVVPVALAIDEPPGSLAGPDPADLERLHRGMDAIGRRNPGVQGESYRTGEPFDARGPGTSDLDIVLIGEDAMAEWNPDAFYLPGVNSQPLWDGAPDVAPELETARAAAQEIAGRPVAPLASDHVPLLTVID